MPRAIIFLTVLDIDQIFKVANVSDGKGKIEHLRRPMKWFYLGFKCLYYLSNNKLSSVGRKLPNLWEMHIRGLQRRIKEEHFLHQFNIGVVDDEELVMFPCVEDSDSYNFDHFPVCCEPVGYYSWGPKFSGSRIMWTGGK